MTPPPPDDRPPAPVLRRQNAPADAPPDGVDAPFAAARLSALVHELANLLDGSMRCLSLAQRSLGAPADPAAAAAISPDLVRRLDTVHAALAQMAEQVPSAKDGDGPDARLGRRPGLVDAWSLEDALRHAAEVMTPITHDAGITISLDIDPGAGSTRCGAIYPPIAAAIRNAIESIQRTGRGRGHISITARTAPAEGERPTPTIIIEIADDGAGPPPLPAGQEDRVFELGFTTKTSRGPRRRATDPAAGIGLAMVRDAVTSLGGSVRLLARPEGGAVLRIAYPMKACCTTTKPGGTEPC